MLIPTSLKLFPLILRLFVFSYLCVFIFFPKFVGSLASYVFGNMLLLTPFLLSVFSFGYYNFLFSSVKFGELGFVNHYFHSTLVSCLGSVSSYFYSLYRFQPFIVVIVGFLFFVFLI